jgi:type IV pilus assembly protein PilV
MTNLSASPSARASRGFTLVEVLVALIVLSIGLLGIAALYVETLKANRTALSRTQAVTLAADLADRIRANRATAGAYACPDPCNPAGAGNAIAIDDLTEWLGNVQAQLPGGAGIVTYTDDGVATTPNVYTIEIDWTEVGQADPIAYQLRVEI